MTVIICIAGAVVGLIVAAISNWLVLPMVLQSQERHFARDPTIRMPFPFPALLGDARRLPGAHYRYLSLRNAAALRLGWSHRGLLPVHRGCAMKTSTLQSQQRNVRFWPKADIG